jgi:PAS domain S-box-containing protein
MTQRLDSSFFRSAIEASTDGFAALDQHGHLLFANRAGLAALRIDDFATCAGRPWATLWPRPGRAVARRAIARASRGRTARFVAEGPAAQGTSTWWDVVVEPIFDERGELTGLTASCRDITAARLKQVEQERLALEAARASAVMRSAFRVAKIGGWEVDFSTRTTLLSPELCELLGGPLLPAMPIAESGRFWRAEDRHRFQSALDQVEAGAGRLYFEGRSAAPDGAEKSWRLFGEPVLLDGKCVAVRGAAQDISEWREAIERERSAVQAADAMSGFLATMSHELRTPLNGVLGMAQAMDRGDLSNVQRLRLGVIQSSADALLSLFNDLIDFSELESHKVELELGVVDVGAIVHDAVSIFEALLEDSDVALHATVAAAASGAWRGDPKRVRQVLHILLSNAVKFTKRGSIAIDVTYDDARLMLRVRDTGVGIAADKLASVFDRFVQGDASPTRGYGGTGLGLAICRDLVKLMGGDVDVESAKGRGSTFTINLPLERAERQGPAELELVARHEAPSTPSALRVLAAEDNDANRRVLAALLGAIGIELVIVENGREALEAWRRGGWDLVLMDIQMPVMDGVEATKLMREAERREGRVRTPIIAVTANAAPQHEVEYLAAGMDAMVAKPIDLTHLMQVMDSALSLQEAA